LLRGRARRPPRAPRRLRSRGHSIPHDPRRIAPLWSPRRHRRRRDRARRIDRRRGRLRLSSELPRERRQLRRQLRLLLGQVQRERLPRPGILPRSRGGVRGARRLLQRPVRSGAGLALERMRPVLSCRRRRLHARLRLLLARLQRGQVRRRALRDRGAVVRPRLRLLLGALLDLARRVHSVGDALPRDRRGVHGARRSAVLRGVRLAERPLRVRRRTVPSAKCPVRGGRRLLRGVVPGERWWRAGVHVVVRGDRRLLLHRRRVLLGQLRGEPAALRSSRDHLRDRRSAVQRGDGVLHRRVCEGGVRVRRGGAMRR
jgi:hypothetical protein